MKNEIVSYKTAKLSKEKGFDEPTVSTYRYENLIDDAEFEDGYKNTFNSFNWFEISAPSQSLLLRWLREEHNIVVEIRVENNQTNFLFISRIYLLNHIKPLFISNLYERYEEALEIGLFEALKLIKNENN